MLVRQTHGDVTAAPTSRVIFQRGRRGRTVDDDTRRTGVLLCDCYQLVIERDLDAPRVVLSAPVTSWPWSRRHDA
jgi:hypothetical protein